MSFRWAFYYIKSLKVLFMITWTKNLLFKNFEVWIEDLKYKLKGTCWVLQSLVWDVTEFSMWLYCHLVLATNVREWKIVKRMQNAWHLTMTGLRPARKRLMIELQLALYEVLTMVVLFLYSILTSKNDFSFAAFFIIGYLQATCHNCLLYQF